jgi:mannose-6-phosphate isomerase-like protein (cupin superfamily)
MLQTKEPTAVPSGQGEARWWFGSLVEIKATAAATGGRFTVVEVTCGPGYEAPLHVHYRDDEGFWILEGQVTLYVGDQTIEAGVGDYAFGPQDVPHRFVVGAEGCRMLWVLVPGGLENLIRATSVPATSRTLPPPPEEPPDVGRIKAVVAEHGYELLV